jgi:hypothetical protein
VLDAAAMGAGWDIGTGEVLEYGVLLSVKQQDQGLFERQMNQLKTYYTDTRSLLPPSEQELPIMGMNLLRLLVQNRTAEFHTQLELLSPEVRELDQAPRIQPDSVRLACADEGPNPRVQIQKKTNWKPWTLRRLRVVAGSNVPLCAAMPGQRRRVHDRLWERGHSTL